MSDANDAATEPIDTQPGNAAQPRGGAANEPQADPEGSAGEAEGRVAQDDIAQDSRLNARKVREGVVTSTSMDKTAVVTIIERVRHRLYGKTVQRSKRLYVHDETNDCRPGDRVRVQETRPMSKQKRWRLVEVLERAR
jgi:small subunit ribosomal protein S17